MAVRGQRSAAKGPSTCSPRPSFAVENLEAVLCYLGSASGCFVSIGANWLRTPEPPHRFWRAGEDPQYNPCH